MSSISQRLRIKLHELNQGNLTEQQTTALSEEHMLEILTQWFSKKIAFFAAQNQELLKQNERLKVTDLLLREQVTIQMAKKGDQKKARGNNENTQELQAKVVALSERCQSYEEGIKALEEQKSALQSKIGEKERETGSHAQSVNQMKASIQRLSENNDSISKDLEQAKKKIAQLTEEMSHQREELQKKFVQETLKGFREQSDKEKQNLLDKMSTFRKETAEAKEETAKLRQNIGFLIGSDPQQPSFDSELKQTIEKYRNLLRKEQIIESESGKNHLLTNMMQQLRTRRQMLQKRLK